MEKNLQTGFVSTKAMVRIFSRCLHRHTNTTSRNLCDDDGSKNENEKTWFALLLVVWLTLILLVWISEKNWSYHTTTSLVILSSILLRTILLTPSCSMETVKNIWFIGHHNGMDFFKLKHENAPHRVVVIRDTNSYRWIKLDELHIMYGADDDLIRECVRYNHMVMDNPRLYLRDTRERGSLAVNVAI